MKIEIKTGSECGIEIDGKEYSDKILDYAIDNFGQITITFVPDELIFNKLNKNDEIEG